MIRHSLNAKLVYWYTACKNRVQADVLASKSMVKHPFELLVVLACNEWIALQLMAMASANICAIYKFTKVKSEMLSLCCCCFFYWAAHAQIIHGRWWKVLSKWCKFAEFRPRIETKKTCTFCMVFLRLLQWSMPVTEILDKRVNVSSTWLPIPGSLKVARTDILRAVKRIQCESTGLVESGGMGKPIKLWTGSRLQDIWVLQKMQRKLMRLADTNWNGKHSLFCIKMAEKAYNWKLPLCTQPQFTPCANECQFPIICFCMHVCLRSIHNVICCLLLNC